jgi:hypothetical protein
MNPDDLPRLIRALVAHPGHRLMLLDLRGDEDARPLTRGDSDELVRRLALNPDELQRQSALPPASGVCVVFGSGDEIASVEFPPALVN